MQNTASKALQQAFSEIEQQWDQDIIPQLVDYIKIPNKSPIFDADWQKHGHMDRAMELIVNWCRKQPIKDMQIKVLREENRTPLLFIDIPGDSDKTVLLYGHMDKQPEMTGWHEDLGPWKPVLKDGKLYGRGGADDGYSAFASLNAIANLQRLNIKHPRCVVLIEGSEESGSIDLPYYLSKLNSQLGNPDLVICLDSSCCNYKQLWGTTSLRGIVGGTLTIATLKEGLHSGYASGVVPSTFMVLQQLLNRIQDPKTGQFLLKEFYVDIPEYYQQQAADTAAIVKQGVIRSIPWAGDTKPVTDDISELILNRSWRPTLSITGIDGVPKLADAGNVVLPEITLMLSIRTPPGCDLAKAEAVLQQILEKEPPFNAKVTFNLTQSEAGWQAPERAAWLDKAIGEASELFFGPKAAYTSEGGGIPFMQMLGEQFPQAQFLITGVLGPSSNAHGPNEFLHIQTAKRVTASVAYVLAEHYTQNQ